MREIDSEHVQNAIELSDDTWRELIKSGKCYQANSGEMVIRRQTPTDRMCLVLSGLINLRIRHTGKVFRTSDFSAPGSVVEHALFRKSEVYVCDAVAYVDGTKLLFLGRDEVASLTSSNPDFAQFLYNDFAMSVFHRQELVALLREPKLTLRVAKYLLFLWDRTGELTFTQREIALSLGIARVSVAKALNRLRKEEIVVGRGRTLRIADRPRVASWIARAS